MLNRHQDTSKLINERFLFIKENICMLRHQQIEEIKKVVDRETCKIKRYMYQKNRNQNTSIEFEKRKKHVSFYTRYMHKIWEEDRGET